VEKTTKTTNAQQKQVSIVEKTTKTTDAQGNTTRHHQSIIRANSTKALNEWLKASGAAFCAPLGTLALKITTSI
jgi:hypothetical protein